MRVFVRHHLFVSRFFAIRDQYESLVRAPIAAAPPKKKKLKEAKKEDEAPLPPPPNRGEEELARLSTSWEQPPDARVARVALVGLANAGKSTLLNALLGSSVAAVSAKAHTTRRGIVGAFTRGPAQVVLVDTPGLVARAEASRRPRELVCAPWEAMETCDMTLIVVDATQPDDWRLNELAERVRNGPRLCPVLNKIDAVDGAGSLVRALERMRELGFGSEPLLVSALRGTHVADLKDELVAAAQPGDWELPEGQASDASTQWRVHEAIRQSIFELLHKEIPYVVKQRTVGWLETADHLHVQQELLLPKDSQARVAVGRGGAVAREIAASAQTRLARALGKTVRLSIRVARQKSQVSQFD